MCTGGHHSGHYGHLVVLQIRDAFALIESDMDKLRATLADLSRRYRDTPMAGRTHLQQALPVTFGYKAAIWLDMFERHAERLSQARPRVLVGEFAGAAGTLASLGIKGWRYKSDDGRAWAKCPNIHRTSRVMVLPKR